MPFTECLIQRKLELLLNCFYAFTSKEICSSLFFDTCNSSHCKIHHVKTKNHPFTNKKSKQCKLHIKYDSNWSNIWYNSWIKPQGNLTLLRTLHQFQMKFITRAPSRQVANWNPLPMTRRLFCWYISCAKDWISSSNFRTSLISSR